MITLPATSIEPGYLALYHSGELERRTNALENRLASCDLCPRLCRVNRLERQTAFCHSAYLPIVSAICPHFGEEPALSGKRGSGTIFFGNCNMRCLYCQNHQISQDWKKQELKEMDCHTLAEKMIYLQEECGCHNINFVTPSHFVPQIVRSVLEAIPLGLHLPLVYNSSGYDSLSVIKELEGIIDIYLPDIRYASAAWAKKLSQAPDYVPRAREAIKEMYRQVGDLRTDESGMAQRGLIVRHLLLPNGLADSEKSLTWLAKELSSSVTVSVMAQYLPLHRAARVPLLSRKISPVEYQRVLELLARLGLENGWVQEMESAESYVPDFERGGHPFKDETIKFKFQSSRHCESP